jgi:hypothetical protein
MAKKSKTPSRDKKVKAKPSGYRFKTKDIEGLTKKDGTLNKKGKKLYFKRPTKAEVEKYKKQDGAYPSETKQVYKEVREERGDANLKKKFNEGGNVVVEMSIEEMRNALGREPKYPYDFIAGKKYTKCFLRPYYKTEE